MEAIGSVCETIYSGMPRGEVADVEETRHGRRYVIEVPLSGALVRSVWMIRTGESFPRLVTAYPIE